MISRRLGDLSDLYYGMYTRKVSEIDDDGLLEVNLPGADTISVTLTHNRSALLVEASLERGGKYTQRVSVPSAFRSASLPTATYRRGVLRIKFTEDKTEDESIDVDFE